MSNTLRPGADDAQALWQREADLLAEGREVLERFCRSRRFDHLFPEGPNIAILFESYQELDRLRAIGRAPVARWRLKRRFARIVLRAAKRDALRRNQRIAWSYPEPRATPIALSPIFERALARVDADLRATIERRLAATPEPEPDPSMSAVTDSARTRRAERQFRDALTNEGLAAPADLLRLPVAAWPLLATAPPLRRQYPLATLLLIQFPLGLAAALVALLVASYLGAWMFFNDAVLGRFVTANVGTLIEGELELGSISWDLPLIVDLATGRPTHVVVEDVSVWEAYKSYGGTRKRRTAHADRLEVTLVLHEIIPWNRLGVPAALEIPWVLHFVDVRSDDPLWVTVAEYEDTHEDGGSRTLLSLIDAFRPVDPDPDRKGLSYAVDAATLTSTTVEVAIGGEEGWSDASVLSWANFSLRFEAPEPYAPMPALPFSFAVEALASEGSLRIGDITVPYEDLAITKLATGMHEVPLGELGFVAEGDAAGSRVALSGGLVHAFPGDATPRPTMEAELWGQTADAGGLLRHVGYELDLPPGTVVAHGVQISAHLWGPIDDVRYRLRADGLTLDAFGKSAWAVDDLVVDATLRSEALPERWRDDAPAGTKRLVVQLNELSGATLDGRFELADDDVPALIVVPDRPGESYWLAADLAVDAVNPGKLFVHNEALAARLTGELRGEIDLHDLRIATGPDAGGPSVDVGLYALQLIRDRGPKDDGLPKHLAAEGRVLYDPVAGLDLQEVVVSTDGARLLATGGLDADLETLAVTSLALRIDDGRAFARAFDLDNYFSGLRADIRVAGPITSPRSPPGRLVIDNLGVFGGGRPRPGEPDRGPQRMPPTRATIALDRGVLRVRSTDSMLLGGRATVDLSVRLFENGELSTDPKLQATVKLVGVRPGRLTDGKINGVVDVDLTLDDGHGGPARLDALRVSGLVAAPSLQIAGTDYKDASMLFELTPEGLEIQRLVLPLHRAVSPFHGPSVTIPVGEVVATGTVGLQSDPSLDLQLAARGVSLGVVARLLDVELPVGGRIDAGTELSVGGTLARPRVDGTVNLVGLAANGIVLGGGALRVTSADHVSGSGLAAHRELRVEGELVAADTGVGPLHWELDAVAAIGTAHGGGTPPIDAEVAVNFDSLTLAALLGAPGDAGFPSSLRGALEGLGAHVTTCAPGQPMLSGCVDTHGGRSLQIDLQLERAWVSGTAAPSRTEAGVCGNAATLCTDTRLEATLDWPIVTLDRPWRLSTGGKSPAEIAVSGSFDLSSGTAPKALAAADCRAPALDSGAEEPEPGGAALARAQVSGRIDLATLAPLLAGYGIAAADGRVDLDLTLAGRLPAPELGGRLTLAASTTANPLTIQINGAPVPLVFTDLDVRVQPGWLTAAGRLMVQGEAITFGSVRGEHTGVGLSGGCAGVWGVAAEGVLSRKLIEAAVGPGIATRGSVTLDRVVVTGPGANGDPIGRIEGSARLGRPPLALELSESVPTVEITDGIIEFARCRAEKCGPTVTPGSLAVWLGGAESATTRRLARTGNADPPKGALLARVGTRGRAAVWGVTHLPLDFSRTEGTAIRAVLEDVAYHDYDARGRPVYEMEVSGSDLMLVGGDPLILSGNVTADRARYVKDAVEGVEILTLTDTVDAPEAPPPAILRAVQFDLRAQTEGPLRVENNIARGVEADVALRVGGTYDAPELSGRIDVDPGGSVDIPFLTGTYEIQFGRIALERDIKDATVDVIALRKEPIYIDNQARQIQLMLGGTVSAITWNCIAEGDAGGAVETSGGCVDYLVLGAGDVQIDQSDVQRLGGGGLANARKSLQVVGHVTEFDFGERIAEAAPRYESFIPDVRLRLGQIGPELDIATPPEWFDFDWAKARFGWDYTRGYPGFLLLQSRELSFQLDILDPVTLVFSRDIRSYLNERIVFDPLRQRTLELRLDFSFPSLR